MTASPLLRRRLAAVIACVALLPAAGCEKAMQDMYDQPKYGPLEPSDLFPDGRSSRTPPAGSLALVTGGFAESTGGLQGTRVPLQAPLGPVEPILQRDVDSRRGDGAGPWMPDLSSLPIQVTADTLRYGQQRFEIFCAPCHGLTGYGDGMVVQRGFPAPPSYHTERLRTAPNLHFFKVITEGYGAMYPYNDRVPQQDRWAIIAYIRALQLSRHAPVRLLAGADRRRLEAGHD
jgi:mono/diheme cytochrome c family protein